MLAGKQSRHGVTPTAALTMIVETQYNTPKSPHEVPIRERNDGLAVKENERHSTLRIAHEGPASN